MWLGAKGYVHWTGATFQLIFVEMPKTAKLTLWSTPKNTSLKFHHNPFLVSNEVAPTRVHDLNALKCFGRFAFFALLLSCFNSRRVSHKSEISQKDNTLIHFWKFKKDNFFLMHNNQYVQMDVSVCVYSYVGGCVGECVCLYACVSVSMAGGSLLCCMGGCLDSLATRMWIEHSSIAVIIVLHCADYVWFVTDRVQCVWTVKCFIVF